MQNHVKSIKPKVKGITDVPTLEVYVSLEGMIRQRTSLLMDECSVLGANSFWNGFDINVYESGRFMPYKSGLITF